MALYQQLSLEELIIEKKKALEEYTRYKEMDLGLNIARGKPSNAQLDLSEGMLNVLCTSEDCISGDGIDCRNYGELYGIPEARKLMGDMLGVPAENTIVCGNSSLAVMFDCISKAFTHGICGSTPWAKLDKIKFLCPVPGYDRHFAITEHFGVEMINIPMLAGGPDMDMVEKYVNNDPAVKGIWCVPRFSNPQGIVYSDETVKRFAGLKPAAEDFRIFWDNAYAVHDLYLGGMEAPALLNLLAEAEKAGNEDIVYMFTSTSKISYAGGGISVLGASKRNIDDYVAHLTYHTICYDKINQYRHVRFFKDLAGIKAQMKKHADILRPKFETVDRVLKEQIGMLKIGSWEMPQGGYFISFEAMEGCAKRIVALAKEAGLILTGAGSVYPYHKDPKDSNIRIAPSMPKREEVEKAAELFAVCVRLAGLEKLIEEKSQA